MRVKNRTTGQKERTWTSKYYEGGEHLTELDQAFTGIQSASTEEFISSENGIGRANPCFHWKSEFADFGPNYQQTYIGRSPPLIQKYGGVYNNVDYFPVPEPPPPQNGLGQFKLRALANIKPKLKADFSIPNFLFELKDLRSIIPSPKQLANYREFLSFVNPFQRIKSRRKSNLNTIDEGAQAVAEQYLNAQFGYLPLLRDMENIVQSLILFNSRVDEFLKKSKKPQLGHYAEVIPRSKMDPVVYNTGPTMRYQYTATFSEVKYIMSLKYILNINGHRMEIPEIYNRYIGFRENPRILWDAVPFSFVIDWILKVGKALESLDPGAIPATLEIVDGTISVSYSVMVKWHRDFLINDVVTFERYGPVLACQKGWQVYRRDRLELDSNLLLGLPPLPVIDGLSIKELTLGAALGKVLTH